MQFEEERQAANELGIEVTEKDIDAMENKYIDSDFNGDRARYEKALRKQFWTPQQFRRLGFGVAVLRTKLFEAVTKDVNVTDQESLMYYTENQSQFGFPDSRDVRHILIAEKDKRRQY